MRSDGRGRDDCRAVRAAAAGGSGRAKLLLLARALFLALASQLEDLVHRDDRRCHERQGEHDDPLPSGE